MEIINRLAIFPDLRSKRDSNKFSYLKKNLGKTTPKTMINLKITLKKILQMIFNRLNPIRKKQIDKCRTKCLLSSNNSSRQCNNKNKNNNKCKYKDNKWISSNRYSHNQIIREIIIKIWGHLILLKRERNLSHNFSNCHIALNRFSQTKTQTMNLGISDREEQMKS